MSTVKRKSKQLGQILIELENLGGDCRFQATEEARAPGLSERILFHLECKRPQP